MVVPLRESLNSTHLLLGRVDGAEPGRNVLSVTPREGHTKELGYDQLIVTVGSISRALPIPGLGTQKLGAFCLRVSFWRVAALSLYLICGCLKMPPWIF